VAGVIEVLLVEDHPIFVTGLRAVIDEQADMRVIAVAGDLAAARAWLASAPPTVAIVDVRLPDGSGFELIDRSLPTRWLLLSSFGTAQYVDATLYQGAHGYFLKSTPPTALIPAIRTIVAGGTAFDPDLLRRRSVAGAWQPLGERERSIIRHLGAGRSNDEIGVALGIATKTVESHLGRLFARFGCTSRSELVARAEREGWLDLPGR
jgi:DNA-binding NarL/FixJ family response regulator